MTERAVLNGEWDTAEVSSKDEVEIPVLTAKG